MSESISINTSMKFTPGEVSLRRVPTSKPGALFGSKMQQVLKREKRDVPFIISACIREVERRGLSEVGVYRVSGSASDLARLKKSFETSKSSSSLKFNFFLIFFLFQIHTKLNNY